MNETRPKFVLTAQVPPSVFVSVVASLGWIAVGAVVTVTRFAGDAKLGRSLPGVIVAVVVALLVVALIQLAIFRGMNWARIVHTCVAGFSVAAGIQQLIAGQGMTTPLGYIPSIAAAAAVVFLWLPSSNKYFGAAKVERHAYRSAAAVERASRSQQPLP